MDAPRYAANLPSVGLATFFRSPVCEDLSKIDADVAFLGIPYDCGIGFRPGTRFGPREMRSFSVRYSAWGGRAASGYWDVNQRKRFLKGVRMVDCGDVDVTYYDFENNRRKMTAGVEAILSRDAFPVLIGGDHSVTFPNVCAFSRFRPRHCAYRRTHGLARQHRWREVRQCEPFAPLERVDLRAQHGSSRHPGHPHQR